MNSTYAAERFQKNGRLNQAEYKELLETVIKKSSPEECVLIQKLADSESHAWVEVERLKEENEQLREALIFYVDDNKYKGEICYHDEDELDAYYEEPEIIGDKGAVARQAIQRIQEET